MGGSTPPPEAALTGRSCPSAHVARRYERGVVSTHTMHTRTRMRVARAEKEAAYGHPVPEVRKSRPPEQLVIPSVRAAADVASNEILVHRFEIGGSHGASREDACAKSGRQFFDAALDDVREGFAHGVPAAF